MEHLPIVGGDMAAAMSAIPQIGDEVFAVLAALDADR